MYSELYKRFAYTVDVNYIISSYIREYDISKANINVLLHYKAITQDRYNYYYNLDKKRREYEIGMLQRNKTIADTLKNGILEFRRRFFEANNIQDYEVVSIKNDAIFLLNKVPVYTEFDNIKFVNKNTYTSFYKITGLELYYLCDVVHNIEKLDIKGINDNVIPLHYNHFYEFLCVLFYSAENSTIIDTLDILKTFHDKYINMKLDIEYYREFNAQSTYTMKSMFQYFGSIKNKFANEKDKELIDINCNLTILRELYKIYSYIYFSQRK